MICSRGRRGIMANVDSHEMAAIRLFLAAVRAACEDTATTLPPDRRKRQKEVTVDCALEHCTDTRRILFYDNQEFFFLILMPHLCRTLSVPRQRPMTQCPIRISLLESSVDGKHHNSSNHEGKSFRHLERVNDAATGFGLEEKLTHFVISWRSCFEIDGEQQVNYMVSLLSFTSLFILLETSNQGSYEHVTTFTFSRQSSRAHWHQKETSSNWMNL